MGKSKSNGGVGVCDVVKLHSGVPSRDQERAFRPPREGRVKVVLSTNIAETSGESLSSTLFELVLSNAFP